MSYHGFGLIYAGGGGQQFVNTFKPVVQTQQIQPIAMAPMVIAQEIEPPYVPAGPIGHRAPPANYSAEAMGCHPKMAIPIAPGKPGYPGFLCVDKAPEPPPTPWKPPIEYAGSGKPSSGMKEGVEDLPGKYFVEEEKEDLPEGFPENYETEKQNGAGTGTMTMEGLALACKSGGGKMGTNCCKMPGDFNVGLQGGQLVQVLQCDVGLGSLPLIAGAVVVALLLAPWIAGRATGSGPAPV